MAHPDVAALFDRLRGYDHVLEVGIGSRTGLAEALVAADIEVTAIDVNTLSTPAGVTFRRLDVTEITPADIGDFDAVVARRLPPELHRPTADLAEAAGADLFFTTLGGEFPAIPVEVTTISTVAIYHRRGDSDTVL